MRLASSSELFPEHWRNDQLIAQALPALRSLMAASLFRFMKRVEPRVSYAESLLSLPGRQRVPITIDIAAEPATAVAPRTGRRFRWKERTAFTRSVNAASSSWLRQDRYLDPEPARGPNSD